MSYLGSTNMNDDFSVPLSRVVAIALSTVGVLMVIAAWIIGAADAWHIGIMIGISSLPIVAAAAVAHVRCYSLRICGLLRAQALVREGVERVSSLR